MSINRSLSHGTNAGASGFSKPTAIRPSARTVKGIDKVVIFADEDGDGSFETRKVFAEGLNLASGIEIGYGGVWIGAAPELLFIPDRNKDDIPDGPPEVLLDGFGYQDTHETLNSFLWGPDGWLYGIQGVFNTARIGKPGVPPEQRPELRAGVWRYHPVRHEFEIFAHGGSNPWGLDYDEHGELFMTHCRSYWGRGFTTHVIQGGQFWNQVNANYAPFIIANPPAEFPEFRNYLLASARYGHGAGGEGTRGSDAIYGGHSHVGTMIYLGDNWPDKYRGHLFTHNLGGHQINHEINEPLGSGYNTVSAGKDMLFCTDPSYVAVDLQYGPDGAVYIIDWVDPQHCHNPNTERWDRTNGRIYRMQWQETFKPVKVDLGAMSDLELVEQLKHKNQWYARTAMRLLHERATRDRIALAARTKLEQLMIDGVDTSVRLKALWVSYLTNELSTKLADSLVFDEEAPIGRWVVQLVGNSLREYDSRSTDASDSRLISNNLDAHSLAATLIVAAGEEKNQQVRRGYASILPSVGGSGSWHVAEFLSQYAEDADDRNLPYLLWHGLAPLIPSDIDRAFALARTTKIPQIADWIYWYTATLGGSPLNRCVESLAGLNGQALQKRLAGLWLAMEPRANLPMPSAWNDVAPRLYANGNPEIVRVTERLASVFGDKSAFPRLRETLADAQADLSARRHAFAVLSRAADKDSLTVFIALLDEGALRTAAINLLAQFQDTSVATALITRFNGFKASDRSAALSALTSRTSFASALLNALTDGSIARDQLTAFHIRRLTGLPDEALRSRVEAFWGNIRQSPAEKLEQISALEKTYSEAPLWAYSERAGAGHFDLLCAQCHTLGDRGNRLGPELTGAGKHGIRYYLENIIDPNAVIGTDFQMTTIGTHDGGFISGLIAGQTDSAITLRTPTGESVVSRSDINQVETSPNSMMPEGLVEALNDREQIELLKFLMTN